MPLAKHVGRQLAELQRGGIYIWLGASAHITAVPLKGHDNPRAKACERKANSETGLTTNRRTVLSFWFARKDARGQLAEFGRHPGRNETIHSQMRRTFLVEETESPSGGLVTATTKRRQITCANLSQDCYPQDSRSKCDGICIPDQTQYGGRMSKTALRRQVGR